MSNCRQCQQDFVIHEQEKGFYKKIEVPEPLDCPDCRQQRRLAFRSNLFLYNRKCNCCKKNVISYYSAKNKFPIYCPDCFYSDNWDPHKYCQDFNFKKPFFEQYKKLLDTVPRISNININSENSDYCNYTDNLKNCYLLFGSIECENCLYGEKKIKCHNCCDNNTLTNSELCYFCRDSENLYNCNFCEVCTDLTDCSFCYDCKGCKNCFACVNLRNKEYCIYNKEYTKEEYNKRIKNVTNGSYEKLSINRKKYTYFISKTGVRRFANIINSPDCTGDYLRNCENCFDCYSLLGSHNCRYVFDDEEIKDSMDCNNYGYGEVYYMGIDGYKSSWSKFCNVITHSQFITYCTMCFSSNHLFGCVGLNKAKHCILNKQYTKTEHDKLEKKIIKHMQKTQEWGEFMPAELSAFGYNETKAMEFYPLYKDESVSQGFKWEDDTPGTFGKETIESNDLPDNISDIKDDILKQVLVCEECSRNYKIIEQELEFYRKKNLPLPRKCVYCRYSELIHQRNPRKLHTRKCDKCEIEIQSTYSSAIQRTVYCDKCYKKAIY